VTPTVTTEHDGAVPLGTVHAPTAAAGPGGDRVDPFARCDACGRTWDYWAHDPLTGLWDRRGWNEQAFRMLESAEAHRRHVALLLADLDRFKSVNDALGHVAGDTVLAVIADVLRANTRPDDLVGRYGGHGGDEFLILLPDASRADAVHAAERIRAAVRAERFTVTATSGPVTLLGQTASIGVASGIPGPGLTLQDLILHADAALLEAKRNGRDRVHSSTLTAA
jgi:diguanylate cyclase (GGDEF)-like protein